MPSYIAQYFLQSTLAGEERCCPSCPLAEEVCAVRGYLVDLNWFPVRLFRVLQNLTLLGLAYQHDTTDELERIFSRKRLAYLFTVNLFHAKMVGRTSFGRLWTKYDKHLEWCQPRIVDAERFSQDCFKNIAAFNKVAEQPTANPFLSFLAFSQFLELFNVFIRIDKCILFL